VVGSAISFMPCTLVTLAARCACKPEHMGVSCSYFHCNTRDLEMVRLETRLQLSQRSQEVFAQALYVVGIITQAADETKLLQSAGHYLLSCCCLHSSCG
jgi:hypothetical protein